MNQSYNQWKTIVEKQPDYRDGYLMLAWYAKELGRKDEAKAYTQRAKIIDPSCPIPEILTQE